MSLHVPPLLRGERRFEKPLRREVGRPGFEESAGPGAPGRKEFARADSDNWRTLREEQDEDEGESNNSWRLSGSRRDGMITTNIFSVTKVNWSHSWFFSAFVCVTVPC